MAQITQDELAAMIVLVAQQMKMNIPTQDLIDMVSIPSRESSYDPFAYNPNRSTGDDSYGLYQINMLGNMGTARANALGITNYKALFDPWINVRAMLQLYVAGGHTLNAWGGYKGMSNTYGVSAGAKASAAQAVNRIMSAAAYGQVMAPDISRFSGQYSNETGMTLQTGPGAPVTQYPGSASGGGGQGGYGSDVPPQGGAGASGGTGGPTSYTNPNPTPPPVTDQQVADYVRDNYGYLVAYLNDPELGPILKSAAKSQLSKDLLYGKLSNTQWWKTTSDTARLWQQLRIEDPATAAGRLASQRAKIVNQLGKLGIYMDGGTLGSITEDSLKFGWSDDQLTDAVLAYAKPGQAGYTQGDLGAYQQQIQQVSASYLLPIAPSEAADYAKRVAGGEMTMDGVKALAQSKAKNMFTHNPDMQKLIDEGVTPNDYFSAHRQAMAQILEVSPDSIDFVNNPAYRQVLDTVDPTTGKHRTMTATEAEQVARDQPQYKNTVNARRAFLSAGSTMATAMGIPQ